MKTRYLTVSLLLILAVQAKAQTVLDDYIEFGLKNNQQLIREQLATNIQDEQAREARGKYMPDVFLDASYTWADGGRLISVPAGDLVNPAYQGLNEILGENRFPADIQNVDEQLLPNDFHETKIRLIQPLLNTDIYYNLMAQKARLSAQKARELAYENQLIKEIKVAYYNHMSAREQLVILISTRGILEELVRVSRKRVENDKATKDVIYGSQAELSGVESQIAGAERQVNVSRIFFNYLISRNLNEEILAEESSNSTSIRNYQINDLTSSALNNREEINQLKYGLEASKASIQLHKNYLVPEINLVGDIGYQGFTYRFDDTQDFWFLRVGLTWPIFQGLQNRSKIQQSLLQEKQVQSDLKETEDLIELEVNEAFYGYQEALKTRQSRVQERKSAEENFRIIQKKYAQGQVILVEYNDARNSFTTSQLQETIAKYNLKIKQAELEASINLKN